MSDPTRQSRLGVAPNSGTEAELGRVGAEQESDPPSAVRACAHPPAVVPQGEVPPFRTVYTNYSRFVRRTLARLGVPALDQDDMTQEVFWVAARRLPEFEGRSSLATWLFAITVRVASNERRARHRRLSRQAPHVAQSLAQEMAERLRSDPLDQAIEAQAARLGRQLLDELGSKKSMMFEQVDLEGRDVADVARELGLNVNTAYSRLRSARSLFATGAARFSF